MIRRDIRAGCGPRSTTSMSAAWARCVCVCLRAYVRVSVFVCLRGVCVSARVCVFCASGPDHRLVRLEPARRPAGPPAGPPAGGVFCLLRRRRGTPLYPSLRLGQSGKESDPGPALPATAPEARDGAAQPGSVRVSLSRTPARCLSGPLSGSLYPSRHIRVVRCPSRFRPLG